MAFGHIMRFPAGDLQLEMAPLRREDMPTFIKNGGMQSYVVGRYLNERPAQTLEDEYAWYETEQAKQDSRVWGIYDITDGRKLIGSSGLHGISEFPLRQAVSGILIFDQSYWGRGVASACHRARTLYAFDALGLVRIKSAVIGDNLASYRALNRVGYEEVSMEYNTHFVDGSIRDTRNLELLNPEPEAWRRWWGKRTPTAVSKAARKRTNLALSRARREVVMV